MLILGSPSQSIPDWCPVRPITLLMNPSLGAYCSSQIKPTTASEITTGRKKTFW